MRSARISNKSYVFLKESVGTVFMVGEHGGGKLNFLIKRDDSLYHWVDSDRTFDSIYGSLSKIKKLEITEDRLRTLLTDYTLCGKSFERFKTFTGKKAFEINGQELHMYDKIYIIDKKTFNERPAIIIGNDKAMCTDGTRVKFFLCRKANQKEIDLRQKAFEQIGTFIKSSQSIELNVNKDASSDYQLFDVYKKGSFVYIYLGKRRINCALKYECDVQFDLPEIYRTGGELWYKIKLGESYALDKSFMKMLTGEEVAAKYKLLLSAMHFGMSGLKVDENCGSYIVREFGCLKFNVKPSILGARIGKFVAVGAENTEIIELSYSGAYGRLSLKQLKRGMRIQLYECNN